MPAPATASAAGPSNALEVFDKFRALPGASVHTAAIQTWAHVTKTTTGTTIQGVSHDVEEAWDEIKNANPSFKLSSSLRACYDNYRHFITKAETVDKVASRATHFVESSLAAQQRSCALANRFLRNGHTILVQGHSPILVAALAHAHASGKLFKVVVAEARPLCTGYVTAKELLAVNIPVEVIADTAVASVMSRVDIVLSGAEAVVESGGIISQIGTYQNALVARALAKPFYVLAESFRFLRDFPLTQLDVADKKDDQAPFMTAEQDLKDEQGNTIDVSFIRFVANNPRNDYTPPELITLLFTDVGILTPAAVSDELIALHNS